MLYELMQKMALVDMSKLPLDITIYLKSAIWLVFSVHRLTND
ncbi:hypothetical protein Aazo_5015 ['Nostoc azollae' 0708]|uniref:Uncharacterized protein n=1 Tax=Nostoc azollae (strain 0708) TaxID=551115 RepID=D7DZA5_NOSA0|nr:hypothetical protein Aazo_5015 ['Nostoc azollae' 0708]